ncbi:hypothetical protein [Litoribacillus peritrichatus]|uniref:Solute-binding protein family 3/N-terminal domain-containing protein n=1 Tax=Litoribacillus peritrichatus TaxID=718191 RepID=A0ABP7N0M9_9GAMM
MAPAPNNEGLYKALYQEVAHNLGCKLSIQRYPKKRTHRLLKSGEADLYPSTGFDNDRAQYLFYIPNGLFRYEAYFGLAPDFINNLKSISEINQYGLTWVFEAGSTTSKIAKAFKVPNKPITKLTDSRAITMLKNGRLIFYRIIKEDYFKYLAAHNLEDLTSLKISTHKSCCKAKSQELYTGISRKSNIYQEEANALFNPGKPLSANNVPYKLSSSSLAYRLASEMRTMVASGRIDALYQQYIVAPGHTP